MAIHPLLPSQKNEVFLLVKDSGIDPSNFVWKDHPSQYFRGSTISALVHAPTGYYFRFDYTGDTERRSYFSPGRHNHADENTSRVWENQFVDVRNWLRNLKRELNEPDLWGAVISERALIGAAPPGPGESDAPFSADERKKLMATLQEIKDYAVKTIASTEEQKEIIVRRLEYLEAASTRMGKKDWMLLAVGVITNIVIAAAFAPGAARELFRFAMQALGWVAAVPQIAE